MKRTRPWFYYFANRALRLAFRLVLRLDVRGVENIPSEGPLIIAISHSSFLDPLLVGPNFPRDITPMAKIEAFDYPVLGWVVRSYGAFPVRRGEADLNAFKMALKILARQHAMVIAPEGHRSDNGALQRGREGAIMLSLRSGAPILPIAVWGGKALWKNLAHLRRTPMWFYVGEPVVPVLPETKATREQMAAMSDELMMRIARMMPEALRGYYTDPSLVTTHYLQPLGASTRAHPAVEEKEVVTR